MLKHLLDLDLLELIEIFRPYADNYGYIVLFLGVMAENASLPVPGETILIIASFYSHHGHLYLPYVIVLATIGCIIGDNISFYVGRRLGRPFITHYGKYVLITKKRLEYVEHFFEKHGDKTIFIQRWITGVRVIGALVAGTTQMPWPRFVLFNCLGAITWVTTISLIAYFLAVNLPLLLKIVGRSGWVLLGLFVVIVGYFYLKRRLTADSEPPSPL